MYLLNPARPISPHRRRLAAGLAGVLALLLLVSAPLGAVSGAGGALTIVSVEHQPDGRLLVALASLPGEADIDGVQAVVDGVPYAAEVQREAAAPLSLVIAIDTSASMDGAPLEAARQAAIGLVERLEPEDRVAVVSFADDVEVLSSFTDGRDAAIASLWLLWVRGNTALYDAVDRSVALLAGEAERTRAVVLLSDGEDTVAGDPGARERSLRSIDASGVAVHTFALGSEADAGYLAEVSRLSGGGHWPVADTLALEEMFARLGDRLGATTEVAIPVPPLARGEHRLEVRARVGGEPAVAAVDFPVTNEGLVQAVPRVAAADTGAGPIVIDLRVPGEPGDLRYTARSEGQALEVLPGPPRLLIDPWAHAPGALVATVEVSNAHEVLASTEVTVEVPALDPALSFVLVTNDAGEPAGAVIGRVQGAEAWLVARAGSPTGPVIAEGPGPELRVPLSDAGGQLELALLVGGVTLQTLTQPLPAPAPPGGLQPLAVLGLGTLALIPVGAAAAWGRRRQATGGSHRRRWEPSDRTVLVGRQLAGTAEAHDPRGLVLVRRPDGEEQRFELRRRPLSVGRSPECDVPIDDPNVAPVHARFYALGNGEFRVHGIAPRGAPTPVRREDEWIVVRHGEQIAIGGYLLTVYAVNEELLQGDVA